MAKSPDLASLLNRLGRIKGQLNGIENALISGRSPFTVLQTAAACRGAIAGLMAEIIERENRGQARNYSRFCSTLKL
jgi:DNA-binding FrmR family transcriptional regulator